MKFFNKKLFLVMGLSLAMQVSASDYDVAVKGIDAGKANFSVQSDGKSYRATLKLYPNFLAKMAGVGNWVDSSQGKIINGHFTPTIYQRTDGEKSLLSVKFSGKKVNINNKDGAKILTVHQMGQDPISQIAQIQSDLKKSTLSKEYYLVTDNNQRLYTSQLVKKQKTYQVTLTQVKGGARTLTLWFDKAFQLTRMKKIKRGKVDFDMIQR